MPKVHRLALLLNRLPHLRSLKFGQETETIMPDIWSIFHPAPGYPIPTGLRNLREFSFHCTPHATRFLQVSLLNLVVLFLLPNLKTVYFDDVTLGGDQDLPSDEERHIGASSVVNIVIEHGNFRPSALRSILQLPKALESFSYTYGSFPGNISNLAQCYHALLPQKSSLKGLKIRTQSHVLPAFNLEVLQNFSALQELSCPVRQIIHNTYMNHKTEDLISPNLRSLMIDVQYHSFLLNPLFVELGDFLQFRRNTRPLLDKLTLRFWFEASLAELLSFPSPRVSLADSISSSIKLLQLQGQENNVEIIIEPDADTRMTFVLELEGRGARP